MEMLQHHCRSEVPDWPAICCLSGLQSSCKPNAEYMKEKLLIVSYFGDKHAAHAWRVQMMLL